MKLTLTSDSSTRSARLDIAGDLDYGHTGRLLDAVAELLSAEPGCQELHLNFAELTFIDSTGLSALFQVHRQASAAGARLYLDDRPAHLNRILDVTGVLDHLTTGPAVAAGNPDETGIG